VNVAFCLSEKQSATTQPPNSNAPVETDALPSPSGGVCHEHERELVMLYQRWEKASRSRLAGVGFKPPSAAAFKRRGSERLGKRPPIGRSGKC